MWEQFCWLASLSDFCLSLQKGGLHRKRSPATYNLKQLWIHKTNGVLTLTVPSKGPMKLYHPFPIAICWWEPACVRCVHTCTANMWDNRAPRPLPWTKTSRRPPNSPLIPRLSSDSAKILQIDCRKSCFIPVWCSKLEKQGFSKSPNVRLRNGLWHVWPVSYQGVAFKELMLKSPP